MLEKLSETGDQIVQNQINLVQPHNTPFHSKTRPPISVLTYFVTVAINAGLNDEQAIAVLILIERLC